MTIAAMIISHPRTSNPTGNFDPEAAKIRTGPIARRTATAKGNVVFFTQADLTKVVSLMGA